MERRCVTPPPMSRTATSFADSSSDSLPEGEEYRAHPGYFLWWSSQAEKPSRLLPPVLTGENALEVHRARTSGVSFEEYMDEYYFSSERDETTNPLGLDSSQELEHDSLRLHLHGMPGDADSGLRTPVSSVGCDSSGCPPPHTQPQHPPHQASHTVERDIWECPCGTLTHITLPMCQGCGSAKLAPSHSFSSSSSVGPPSTTAASAGYAGYQAHDGSLAYQQAPNRVRGWTPPQQQGYLQPQPQLQQQVSGPGLYPQCDQPAGVEGPMAYQNSSSAADLASSMSQASNSGYSAAGAGEQQQAPHMQQHHHHQAPGAAGGGGLYPVHTDDGSLACQSSNDISVSSQCSSGGYAAEPQQQQQQQGMWHAGGQFATAQGPAGPGHTHSRGLSHHHAVESCAPPLATNANLGPAGGSHEHTPTTTHLCGNSSGNSAVNMRDNNNNNNNNNNSNTDVPSTPPLRGGSVSGGSFNRSPMAAGGLDTGSNNNGNGNMLGGPMKAGVMNHVANPPHPHSARVTGAGPAVGEYYPQSQHQQQQQQQGPASSPSRWSMPDNSNNNNSNNNSNNNNSSAFGGSNAPPAAVQQRSFQQGHLQQQHHHHHPPHSEVERVIDIKSKPIMHADAGHHPGGFGKYSHGNHHAHGHGHQQQQQQQEQAGFGIFGRSVTKVQVTVVGGDSRGHHGGGNNNSNANSGGNNNSNNNNSGFPHGHAQQQHHHHNHNNHGSHHAHVFAGGKPHHGSPARNFYHGGRAR